MTHIGIILLLTLLGTGSCVVQSCSEGKFSNERITSISYTGSTPGDEIIKTQFNIPVNQKVDFIRWDLTLYEGSPGESRFELNINFGEAQQNTLGFIGGGERKSFTGSYSVFSGLKNKLNGKYYRLISTNFPNDLFLLKLNENLFHILTPDYLLLNGNGGWSYTLNRMEPIMQTLDLPELTNSLYISSDTAVQVTYDGRTPCFEMAREYDLTVSSECIKLKWRLILKRDPDNLLPLTFQLQRTDLRQNEMAGSWSIIYGTKSNPSATVFHLNPNSPHKPIYLLALDENVIFFLNKDFQPFVGNSDFSFTLNRID